MDTGINYYTLWSPDQYPSYLRVKDRPGIYQLVKKDKEWVFEFKYFKFDLPSKIYGKSNKYANHIINKFLKSKSSLSALFTGLKGSGKTNLAQLICNILVDKGYPVYLITEITPDDKLLNILSNLKDCVLLFDEFGKVFNGAVQQKLLTMLTDKNPEVKKLFILTENNTMSVNSFMLNRPGRIYYHIDFQRLDKDIVLEYCKDRGVDKEFTEELLKRYVRASTFTFDHLDSVVTEHLEYPDLTFDEILEILNVSILDNEIVYDVISITKDGKEYVSGINVIKEKAFKSWDGVTLLVTKKEDLNNSSNNPPNPVTPNSFGGNGRFPPTANIRLKLSDVSKIEGDIHTIVTNDFTVKLLKRKVEID